MRSRTTWFVLVPFGLLLAALLPAAAAPVRLAWGATVNLSAPGQSSDDPQIALDAKGNAVAVWDRSSGAWYVVQAAKKPKGGVWSAPVNLSAAGAYFPHVSLDPNGNAVAVWMRSNGVKWIVQASSSKPGLPWSAPVNLSAPGQDAISPYVRLDANGTAVVVWTRSNGSNLIVQAARRPNGGAWSAPTDLSAPGHDSQLPNVAVDPSGDAVAVWYREIVGNGTAKKILVQAAVRPNGGVWSAPTDLNALVGAAYDARVAIDPNGNAIAVWTQYPSRTIQAATRPKGGAWSAPVNIDSGHPADSPQIALDAKGNAVAVWMFGDGWTGGYVVRTAGKPKGGPWAAAVDISPFTELPRPQLGLAPNGNAVVVWQENSTGVIEAMSRPKGGGWSAPVGISIPSTDAQLPQVAYGVVPQAIAVWERDDGTNHRIIQSAAFTP